MTRAELLFMNRGPGSNGRWIWEEVALQAGVGFSESGDPVPAWEWMRQTSVEMDGRICLLPMLITRCFRFYENNKDETFRDAAQAHGVARATRLLSAGG